MSLKVGIYSNKVITHEFIRPKWNMPTGCDVRNPCELNPFSVQVSK